MANKSIYISVQEASRLSGKPIGAIYKLVKAGDVGTVKARKTGKSRGPQSVTYVSLTDVERLATTTTPPVKAAKTGSNTMMRLNSVERAVTALHKLITNRAAATGLQSATI